MWLSHGWCVDACLWSNSDLKASVKSACLYCRLLPVMLINIINFGGCKVEYVQGRVLSHFAQLLI